MKHRIEIHWSDVTELYDTISKVMLMLGEQMETDIKEINVYRLDNLEELYHKVHKRTTGLRIGKPVVFHFELKDVLTLRYCLLRRRMTPGMNELFATLDKKVNRKMFERE